MRVVILCGGTGSRLWPESRQNLPKQFLSIFEDKSLLDLTIERILEKIQDVKPIFICNKNHGFLVKKALERYGIKADIFLEPEGKNTCAAIYIAAKHCSPNENLLILPSDHFISNKKEFIKDISIIEKNMPSNYWVTLGVKPTYASQAYGYIKSKKRNDTVLREVLEFVEKPSKKTASEFISSDNYYWNAGIFFATSKTITASIKKFVPDIAKHCDNNYKNIIKNDKNNEYKFIDNLFSYIPSKSIDYAVMEHEKKILMYPINSNWNDVGSWDSIANIINESTNQNVIQIDSEDNFIFSKKRFIATIGISNSMIIDSDNATLVCKKGESEKVKDVYKQLEDKNIFITKEHSYEYRPWGKFENLLDDKFCKVKRILVLPKRRLSLQYHNFRSEHWLIISGKAGVHLQGKNFTLTAGQSIDIPIKSHHYIENKGDQDLIVIETQLGTYFGEDDIIRLDDPYER